MCVLRKGFACWDEWKKAPRSTCSGEYLSRQSVCKVGLCEERSAFQSQTVVSPPSSFFCQRLPTFTPHSEIHRQSLKSIALSTIGALSKLKRLHLHPFYLICAQTQSSWHFIRFCNHGEHSSYAHLLNLICPPPQQKKEPANMLDKC